MTAEISSPGGKNEEFQDGESRALSQEQDPSECWACGGSQLCLELVTAAATVMVLPWLVVVLVLRGIPLPLVLESVLHFTASTSKS